MASSLDEVVSKLRADPDAAKQFRDAYEREPDRAFASGCDRDLRAITRYAGQPLRPMACGEADAITPDELSGYQMFKSLGCITCHQGVNVGGNLFQRHGIFHPLGLARAVRFASPAYETWRPRRPISTTAARHAAEAVKAMGIAQLDRMLTDQQIAAIVAFLDTLTGTYRVRWAGLPLRTACSHGPPMKLWSGALGVLLLLALLTWLLLRGIHTTHHPMRRRSEPWTISHFPKPRYTATFCRRAPACFATTTARHRR